MIRDENTDVMAHLTGFGCGFLLGWINGELEAPWRFSPTTQATAAAVALAVLLLAWLLAA